MKSKLQSFMSKFLTNNHQNSQKVNSLPVFLVETFPKVHQRPNPEPTMPMFIQVSCMSHLYGHLLPTATSNN